MSMRKKGTDLVERIVPAVENELDGDVRAVLNAANAPVREADVQAEGALACGPEERDELLELAVAVLEAGEGVGVRNG